MREYTGLMLKPVEPVMHRYRVLTERVIEEEIIVEAETEVEAVDMVLEGQGQENVYYEWAPVVTLSEEIE